MSTSLLVLKAIGPALAQGLLNAFDVKSKLANAIEPKAITTVTRDLLKSATGQNALGQVEVIAKQMVNDIRPLFEGQDRQVSIASRDSILFGLAQTLCEAGLSQTGLAEMNFDVDELEQHLLKTNPGVERDFSVAEQAIYRQTVRMVSQRLIEAAPTVEGYEQARDTEVLQRLEIISQQLGVERDLALQSADEFVERYRSVVQNKLDRLEVFGLPRMDRLTSQQSLSMAYITLSASRVVDDKVGSTTAALKRVYQEGEAEWEGKGKGKGSRRILSQVDEAMCDCRRLVIRGGAGAGKSTLMQWLAVRAASMSFEENLAAWNTKIPFFIRLRSLVGKEFPAPEQFPALIAKNIAAQMPDNWVHKYLARGQALVLIDGVDELPRNARGEFFEALKDLVADFPQATYIVTSRPSGLKSKEGGAWDEWEAWVSNEEFKNLTLEPMTATNVEEFVTRWHAALPKAQPGDPLSSPYQDSEQTVQNLNRQLKQRPELMRLASMPLLCAMICALHRERLETLPSARLKLYSECIDMLLNRRDAGRKIALDESYPIGLNEDQKIELLQSLALKLMRADLSSLEMDRVDEHFGRELKKTNLPEAVTGDQIRALFIDRAALLREPIVGQVDFAHRTFQEYLAAKAVLEEDNLEELLKKASDDQWREAMIVAAGLARPAERGRLLQWLVDKGNGNAASKARTRLKALIGREKNDSDIKNRKYLHLLAVACLETAIKIKPEEIRSYVLDCAKASMPPRDDDEVAMVVRAGNEALPLLKYEASYSAEEASRCIQALVSLGTSAAMEALVDYAKQTFKLDHQSKVAYALGRGWDVFNQETYLAQILSHTNKLSLSGTQVSDVSALSALSQLNSLSLSSTQVSDVSALSALSQLNSLSLSSTQVSDVSALSVLSQLNSLDLRSTQVSDVSALSALSQLNFLDLRSTQVSDVSALSTLSQLNFLYLSSTQVSDVSALSALSQLNSLSLSSTQVSDVSALSALSQLNSLDLRSAQVSDVSALSALSQLKILYLSRTQVSDVSALGALSQLKTLYLSGTQVSDVSALSALSQLKTLYLSGTQVSDVSALKHLKKLTIYTDNKDKSKQWATEGLNAKLVY
ncbi:MAG: leucine-rich repeat domain-containing protein [Cyanobacteria bacterium P01_C01_bin.118]